MRTIHTSVPGRMDVRMVHMILGSTPFYKISHVETEKTTPKTHSYAIEICGCVSVSGVVSSSLTEAKISQNHPKSQQ